MKPSHDLSGLIKYLSRAEWQDRLEEVMGDHFAPIMTALDIEYEEIGEILGEHWDRTLWGCAFEDFLTQGFDPDGVNIVDDYIKRRGWNEKVQSKAYMKALRTSVMSLYEASEIVPGQSMSLRDMVRGGEPLLVHEHSATQSLKTWDRIAARVVPMNGKHILAGGVLPFTLEGTTLFQKGFDDLCRQSRDEGIHADRDALLADAASLFTNVWLFDTLPKAMGLIAPMVYNSDGDELVFHSVRFPLATGVTQKAIGAQLDTVKALHRESATFWNWLGTKRTKRKSKKADGVAFNSTMEDGTTILGNIELKGRFVTLMVNSAERAKAATALFTKSLGNMVRAPLTEIQTIDQMRADHEGYEAPQSVVPPEIATKLVHEMLDKSYRETLDQPVGMLGDITPRAASKSANGRVKLVEWLKHIENRSAQQPDDTDPMATYDYSWLWHELGVEHERR